MVDHDKNSEAISTARDEHRRLVRRKARMAVTKVVIAVFAAGLIIEVAGLAFGLFSLRQIVVDSAVPVAGAALFLVLLANDRWADLAPWVLVIAMLIEPILVPSSGPILIFDTVLPLTLLLLLLARRRTVRRLEREIAHRTRVAETPATE
jgi:Mn2+/Fe2+ NRAMP family transporter